MSQLGKRMEDKLVFVVSAGFNKGIQQGRWTKSVLRKACSLGKKAINSSVEKMLIREVLEHPPTLHKKGMNRIKNNKIRSALQSDLASYDVHQATGLARERFM